MLRFWVALMAIITTTSLTANAQTIRLRDTVRLRDSSSIIIPLKPSPIAQKVRGISDHNNDPEILHTRRNILNDSIKSEGFVSQSFASGNRRDLSPNTTADLKVSAKMAGGIVVTADIADSDMPMDDEGVTNQISELSSVLITAAKDSTILSVGDIVAGDNRHTLTSFSKKIKGVELATVNGLRNGDTIAARSDFAATKGKFRRQQFFGKDNSQGPYYLNSGDPAATVIVLTGTEKVWLDGVPLSRGEDADYSIDYNSGSITFANKHIITSQSTITVDFEYSESVYNNYFLYAEGQYKRRGVSIDAGYISEYDGLGAAADSAATDTTMARPRRNDFAFLGFDAHFQDRTLLNIETTVARLTADRLNASETTNRTMATTIDLKHVIIKNDTSQILSAQTKWIYFSDKFQPLTTDKNVDFQEKWDLKDYHSGNMEIFSDNGIKYHSNFLDVNYTLKTAKIDGEMDGVAHEFLAVNNYRHLTNSISADFYDDTQSGEKHQYFSGFIKTEYQKDSLKLGASLSQKSRSKHDSISPNYRDISAFAFRRIRNGNFGITITNRTNFENFFVDPKNYSGTTFIKGEFNITKTENYTLQILEVYRKDIGSLDDNNSLSSSINGVCQLFDRQLNISVSQHSSNGNQEQMAYKFIRTSTGNGHYTWNDYNGDGIEDLDEFEISYYKTDADYVKYFVHTGKYINTIQNDWNCNVILHCQKGKTLFSALMSRISATANIDLRRQDARHNGGNIIKGDSLISRVSRQNYTEKIRIWDFMTVGNNWSGVRQERQTFYGLENNHNETSGFFMEFDPDGGFSAKIERKYKVKNYFSEYFPEKCYRIHATEDVCETEYDFGNGFKLGLGACYNYKKNKTDTTSARINSINFSAGYSRDGKGDISFNSRIIKNKYDENASSGASSYQMLEGLNIGINGVIAIDTNYMITKYLQLSLLYELRASRFNTLHTGEMALKLIF